MKQLDLDEQSAQKLWAVFHSALKADGMNVFQHVKDLLDKIKAKVEDVAEAK